VFAASLPVTDRVPGEAVLGEQDVDSAPRSTTLRRSDMLATSSRCSWRNQCWRFDDLIEVGQPLGRYLGQLRPLGSDRMRTKAPPRG
jgi:hypothetical protein